MNILYNNKDSLKYIKMWNKIKDLFKNLSNKRGLNEKPIHNSEYRRNKISPFNENFDGNKKLIKNEHYSTSVLLIESICEEENKYYSEIFFRKKKLKNVIVCVIYLSS